MDLGSYFSGQFNDPSTTLGSMYSYLQGENRVPKVNAVGPDSMDEGDLGEYRPDSNTINVIPYPDQIQNTMPHEFVHATNHAILNRIQQPITTPLQRQLSDAYTKLRLPSNIPSGLHMITPDNIKFANYRTSPEESPAFGLANMMSKPTEKSVGNHYDASAAQEFQVLLDLAKREQATRK